MGRVVLLLALSTLTFILGGVTTFTSAKTINIANHIEKDHGSSENRTLEQKYESWFPRRTKRSAVEFLQRPLQDAQRNALNLTPRGIWNNCKRQWINDVGIMRFRIEEVKKNAVRGHPGPPQNVLYCDDQGWFPAYWLPWWSGAKGPVDTLPSIDFEYDIGIQFLFTGLLSGCSIVVVEHPTARHHIRVYHDNNPDYPADKWHGLNILAQVSWCNYGNADDREELFAVTFMYFDSTKWYLVTQCLRAHPRAISYTVRNNDLQYVFGVRRCPHANYGNLRVVEVPRPHQTRVRTRTRDIPETGGSRSQSRSRSLPGTATDDD